MMHVSPFVYEHKEDVVEDVDNHLTAVTVAVGAEDQKDVQGHENEKNSESKQKNVIKKRQMDGTMFLLGLDTEYMMQTEIDLLVLQILQ